MIGIQLFHNEGVFVRAFDLFVQRKRTCGRRRQPEAVCFRICRGISDYQRHALHLDHFAGDYSRCAGTGA